ncbi:MAG: protocatechuate 3,4-dioxygenase [Planctomycetaceae bacterium]|nr:protocatechuate 3,4-dioxygenase [Planctomycetaceae bacterium]
MTLPTSRRQFLQSAAFLAAAWNVRGAFAEELALTPSLTEGPFYPDHLPLDTDNDLLVLNDALTPAIGEITHLSGRILNAAGNPIRNAFVEIWQVDGNGAYLHTGDSRHHLFDKNFQGYGRFLTDAEGRYYFRTIKPVPYPGRTPHIHFGISQHGKRVFTTQLLIKGHPQNERDGVFRNIREPATRELLLADFQKLPDSKIGELAAHFDIVLGKTPPDAPSDDSPKGIGKSERESGGGRGPGVRPPGPPPRP